MAVNTAGVLVNMVTGLVVMPFLIQRLGPATYGLWSLIGSLTGYLGVLDFGVRPAVGRLIAAHRARGEIEEVNAVVSTAVAILCTVSLATLLATMLAVRAFPAVFPVPPDRLPDVAHALVLIGLTVAVGFPASVFDGCLWGHERFDLLSAVDATVVLLRTVLIFALVRDSAPLATLAGIVFAVTGLGSVVKGIICFRIERRLRVSPRSFRRHKVWEIYSYGSWMSLITWSKTLTPQMAPALIGHSLGTAAVTSFAVGRQLVAYADIFANAATQVVAPRAIAAHAVRADGAQEKLFFRGSELALALALYFGGGLLCLGLPFIHCWQHGSQDGSYRLMIVLLAGQILPMSQWITYSILVGSNRHRLVGALAIFELIAVAGLATIAVHYMGLLAVCAAVALSGFLTRGVIQMVAGCRLLKIAVGRYVRQVFVPVSMASAPPIAILAIATIWVGPRSFAAIGVLGAGYSILFALIVGLALVGPAGLKTIFESVVSRAERFG